MLPVVRQTFTQSIASHPQTSVFGLEPSVWVTIVLGAFAALIAYRQWRTSDSKLRLDLYERRLPIYQACRSLLAAVTQGNAGYGDVLKYWASIEQAPFVLPSYARPYLEELGRNAGQLIVSQKTSANLAHSASARQTAIDVEYRLNTWFGQQYELLEEKFTPLIRLEGGLLMHGRQALYVLTHLKEISAARQRRAALVRQVEEEIARGRVTPQAEEARASAE